MVKIAPCYFEVVIIAYSKTFEIRKKDGNSHLEYRVRLNEYERDFYNNIILI